MICDTLEQLHLYKGFHKNLDTAIAFLAAHPLDTLPLGRTEVDGDEVFINVMDADLKPHTGSHAEYHRLYADLQIGVEPVIFGVGTGVGFEIGIHHIDEHLVAVHFGTAQRQGIQRVCSQKRNGRVEVFVEPFIQMQLFQGIADHTLFPPKKKRPPPL